MIIEIPLNQSMAVTARIERVEDGPLPGQVSVFVSCEDLEEAQLLAALNISDEDLDCHEE